MKLTTEQLENGLKYEIDLSRKLKKELKRIEEELKKCQERMVDYNRELNKSKITFHITSSGFVSVGDLNHKS